MKIRVIETINEFKRHFGLNRDGILLEPDLDEIETECDLDSRKRRDAEVLCTLAANISGPCLDLGTSHGRSAYKLATNLGDRGRVFTVNVLPEQMDSTCGKMITHALEKEQIGAYFRNLGIANIEQHYANTARWDVPPQIADLALVFVDAAHDTEMVWSDSHLILPRVAEGGFIVWHDFSPPLRQKWDWIDASMRGVEKFLAELGAELEVVHLRGSWTAVWRKTTSKSGRATPRPPRVNLAGRRAARMTAPISRRFGTLRGQARLMIPFASSVFFGSILDTPRSGRWKKKAGPTGFGPWVTTLSFSAFLVRTVGGHFRNWMPPGSDGSRS
ncbi:MAG: class I SAM-dependent methyltransferase [Verrucomicrobiota bacterium]